MDNKKTIRYFYQCNDGVMFLENDDDFIQTITKQNKCETVKDYNYYEMFSDYEMSLNGLQKFREDFKNWLFQYFEGLDMKKKLIILNITILKVLLSFHFATQMKKTFSL